MGIFKKSFRFDCWKVGGVDKFFQKRFRSFVGSYCWHSRAPTVSVIFHPIADPAQNTCDLLLVFLT